MADPIGPYYGRLANRLLTYLLLAAGLIIGAFVALWIAGDMAFILRDFPLVCTLALYLAVVFTFSHVLADLAANHLWPTRLAYGGRCVGGQWVVLFSGLVLGFCLDHGAFPELMRLCAQGPDSQLPINLSVVPLWCATLYACLLMVHMSCNEAGQDEPAAPVRPVPAQAAVPRQRPAAKAKPATASFRIEGRRVKVPLAAISHASMEDHYCRVYFQGGQGLQDILVRETLKGLISQAGPDVFLQIHRSHLVNKAHVSAYKQRGRDHWLLLGPAREPVPISRRRRGEVKEALADVLGS